MTTAGKIVKVSSSVGQASGTSDRQNYSVGTPQEGGGSPPSPYGKVHGKLLTRSVGRKEQFPLSSAERAGIDRDLAPARKANELYDQLPPEERAGLSRQEFLVAFAMMEAVRVGR